MKRRVVLFLSLLTIVFVCVYFAGIKMESENQQNKSEDTISSTASGEISSDVVDDDEKEFIKTIDEENKKIETQGNIFPKGSYQVYGGFGYQIRNFCIYETYDKFKQSDYYCSDYEQYSPVYPADSVYVFLEVDVTNERTREREFNVLQFGLLFAQDGSAYVEDSPQLIYDASPFYVSETENAKDEKSKLFYQIKPSETITTQMCFSACFVDDNTGETYKIHDVFENPEYYLAIEGSMTASNRVYRLEDDKMHIYIECE